MRQNTRVTFLAILLVIGIIGVFGFNMYQYQKTDSEQAFGEKVRAYLLDNPKIIREVIEKLSVVEAREKAEQERQALSMYQGELENDGFSYVAGNPNGDITIVEFFDYRCGYCKQSFPEILKAVESDGNIRLVFKEFPILGPPSVLAAHAAMSAQKQNKYMEYHTALMQMRGSITEEKLLQLAADLGLEIDKFKSDMKSADIEENISRTYALANQLNITGTPAFVIGGRMAAGAIPAQRMLAMVEDAREQKKSSVTN
ncbi:DsbA family protein [Sneathiella glossodoripedis]|uniref:DsbA family protein n=1 Tax=Sneathiella glossodoripedis TaxID=418853 RepID=UPI000471A674|nr:DsbA family protein [Sneathiella glossodoripedis]